MSHGSDLILLGKVAGTHGIKGQLRVISFSGELENILALKSILLKSPTGEIESFAVTASAVHGKKILFFLSGMDDINKAEPLVGRELYAYREQLPALADDEYYWFQLQGLTVVTVQGEVLGTITSLIPTGSNDVYVVTCGGREYLIPAVEDIVISVDLDKGIMTVSPPDGLLDL